MINLYLARHGQTDWNKNKRFQSRNDIPLNDVGIQQAHDLKKCLDEKSIEFDVVFSSPLSRAFDTAKILSAKKSKSESVSNELNCQQVSPEIICDERLLEMKMGIYDGEYESNLEQQYGDSFIQWRDSIFIETPPQGESLAAACARCEDFFNECLISGDFLKPNQTVNVLIVAHQGINLALQTVFAGKQFAPFDKSLHQYKQHNDQINIWQSHDNSMTLPLSLSEQLHL